MTDRELTQRITDYLTGGGLFNPEMANHEAVRDLLIDCRDVLAQPEPWDTSDMAHRAGGLSVEQEPVAWLVSDAQGRYATIRDPAPYGEEVYEPLYAAPVSKPWVSLTEKERCTFVSLLKYKTVNEILNDIEDTLRSKNDRMG